MMLAIIAGIYALAAGYTNLITEPGAGDFLSRKIGWSKAPHVPVWLTVMHVHVIAAALATLAGALNFIRPILRKHPRFHRVNGYLYVAAVMIVDLTSGYMAPYATGGKVTSIAFNFMNLIWVAVTLAAIVQIRRKRVENHRKWMIRSYVFCFTNLFIHGVRTLLHDGFGVAYPTCYTIGVYAAIVLIFIAAEIAIRAGFARVRG